VPGDLSTGWARVRRVAGTDRFLAYGVVNDGGSGGGGTSDGSLIVAGGSDGILPIVLDLPDSGPSRTELTLTNPGPAPAAVTLVYTPAPLWGVEGGGVAKLNLGPGRQLDVPDAIAFLRENGLAIPPGRQGGTLRVIGAVGQARTFSANPDATVGGTFGLSYPAVPAASRAREEAVVCGLRQDGASRSNLAVADARSAGGPLDYVIEVFDTATGAPGPSASFRRTLGPGEWVQINGILSLAGIGEGWARVRPAAGASDFVAYGVLNDGASPGRGTSDGSFLPMVVLK